MDKESTPGEEKRIRLKSWLKRMGTRAPQNFAQVGAAAGPLLAAAGAEGRAQLLHHPGGLARAPDGDGARQSPWAVRPSSRLWRRLVEVPSIRVTSSCLSVYVLLFLDVGFNGNLSLLEIFVPVDLNKWKASEGS